MSTGFWGNFTYGAGDRVPLRAVKCKSSASPTSKAHVCRQHEDHVGDHRCVCGKKWEREATA